MKKNAPWNFAPTCHNAFQYLKDAFTRAPTLQHFNPTLPIIVETNASNYAITTIIFHVLPDGSIHPVVFHSQTLNATKLNYDTHDKELLAMFEAFTIWRHCSGSEGYRCARCEFVGIRKIDK